MKWSVTFVTSLAIVWSVGFSYTIEHQQKLPHNEKICQRVSIWEWEHFDMLRGCSVIEGSLQINMVFINPSADFRQNITFPELREITGFLMAFSTPKIISLKTLFPNLAVIRGQELIENYALLIYKMPGMQEIGLPSLTNIVRGAVWIVDNENLCYVDTVDWTKIANESNTEGIFKNKQQCPDTCSQECPKSDLYNDRTLCWSKEHCQVVPHISCPKCNGRACFGDKQDCCHPQCLGGCYGPNPNQCQVCKGVVVNSKKPGEGPICRDKCPSGLYEYLQRRCVSSSECLNITAIAPINHPYNPSGNFSGKWYTNRDGTQMCVLECPKNTELAPNGTACISCDGTCKKNCQGRTVDSIEAARDLSGCTRITGALKIHIRRSSSSTVYGTIVKELKENLDKIEEIDHYLAVTYTYSIYSLDFLSSLKVIKGQVLDDKKYALIVKSNENLMELWNGTDVVNRKITIENRNARVLFHYNPKLCQSKIWEFVHQAEIKPPAPNDNIDIGITNGDKAPCNTKKLMIEVLQKSNSTVIIRWENLRRNLTRTSHLLNYEIHYKLAHGYPQQNESKFDDRDPCGDDGWNVQEQAKISDNEVKGIGVGNEPRWENEALIANLDPYTYYALYVKAIVIQDTDSINNNTGAESDIIYFRTYADYPTKPVNVMLASSGPDKITANWEPPFKANGEMKSFKIWIKSVPESQSLQDQRNYCEQNRAPVIPPISSKGTDSFISTTFAPILSATSKDADCCSCSAPQKTSSKDQKINKVFVETDIFDIIMGNYLFRVPSGNSRSASPTSRPEDDPTINEIRKSRRRRSSSVRDEHSSASNEVTEHEIIEFPSGSSHKEILENELASLPINKELTFLKEIPYNSSVLKYSFVLDNLTHYTTYYIGIQACRAIDPNITENDTRTCSEIIDDRVQTAKSPTADNIDPRSISWNVTDSHRLHLRWAEPLHPNGVVMAYVIVLQKVGASKEEYWGRKCITHAEFIKNGKNYTYSDHLSPGNYSLRIQVASLAQDSEFSAVQYFYIEDINETSPGFWVLVILLPLLLILLIAGCFVYWIWTNYPPTQLVVSPNPEYMPNVDIAEEWEVPRDKVRLLKALGQGSFGTVYEGKLLDFIVDQPDLFCAVKTVADDTPSEERALFLKEAALMTKLNCNHVVKLLGIVSKSQPIFVIMELMENGDLKQYLRSRRPDIEKKDTAPPPTLKQILRIAAEIADGMSYIHSQKLVHRDLACRNCLVQ
ncbi:Insulin-like peptide receptor [Folsomia candida]|uniref:receptor protein-tyrosine kinase n=1 Tax=Folsomia candida TaxID=158441 RepID=A0A226EW47_FOLCA|nr:Insulin-like peptide receptor [Folsomia candida]